MSAQSSHQALGSLQPEVVASYMNSRGGLPLSPEQVSRFKSSALTYKRSPPPPPRADAMAAAAERLEYSQNRCAELVEKQRRLAADRHDLANALRRLQAENDALRAERGVPTSMQLRALGADLAAAESEAARLRHEATAKDARVKDLNLLLEAVKQGLAEKDGASKRAAAEYAENSMALRTLRTELHAVQTKLKMVGRKLQLEVAQARREREINAQLVVQLATMDAEHGAARAAAEAAAAASATALRREMERTVATVKESAAQSASEAVSALHSLAAVTADRDALRAAAASERRDEDIALLAQQLVRANETCVAQQRELQRLRAGSSTAGAAAARASARASAAPAAAPTPAAATSPPASPPASAPAPAAAAGCGEGRPAQTLLERARRRAPLAPILPPAASSSGGGVPVAPQPTTAAAVPARRWHSVVDESEDGGVLRLRGATPARAAARRARATPLLSTPARASRRSPRPLKGSFEVRLTSSGKEKGKAPRSTSASRRSASPAPTFGHVTAPPLTVRGGV